MTSATEFQAKVDKGVENFDKLDQIVNGGTSVTVETDSGTVPSLAKVTNDFQESADEILEGLGDVATAVTTATAAATTATTQAGIATAAAASVTDAADALAGLQIKTGGIAREERSYGYTWFTGSPLFPATPSPAGRTYLINRPLLTGDRLLGMRVNLDAAGTGQLGVFTPTYEADGVTVASVAAIALYNVTVTEGEQIIAYPDDASFPDHRYPAGSLAGYYADGDAVILYRGKAGPEGPALRVNALAPGIGVSRVASTANIAPDMAMIVDGVVPDITENIDELKAKTRRFGKRKAAPGTAGNSLYRWRSKQERIKGGDSGGIARILLFGSSIAGFRELPQGFATALGGSVGLCGHGWLGVNGHVTQYRPLNDATATQSAGWTTVSFAPGLVGIDGYAVTTTTAGASRTWTNILCKTLDIWTDNASGIFEYQLDGAGAWTQVASTGGGTSSYRKTTVDFGTQGLHSITIRTVDTALFRLCGLYARGSVNGVEMSQAGHGGSDHEDWESFIAGVVPIITDIDPDIQIITVDTNALRGHRAPASYKEYMLSIVAALQEAAPSSAIDLWTHADIQGEYTYAPADYGAVHDEIARDNDMVEVYSCLDRFAAWEIENSLGTNADDLHLSSLGGRKAAADYCQVRLGVDPTHEIGATKNASNEALRDRSTHTGKQPMSSVEDLPETLALKADTLDVFEPTTNLFDKDSSDLVEGYYVRGDTGVLTSNESYNALQFIPIKPDTEYTFSRSGHIAWYTEAQAYIDGDTTTADNTPRTETSPSDAAFVGVSVKPAWMDDFRINEGDAVLDWEPAGLKFKQSLIADALSGKADADELELVSSDLENLTETVIKHSTNLFDKDSPNIVEGYYVRATTGNLNANANYNALRFIAIKPSTQYTFSRSSEIAWFTAAQAYISGDATTADNTPKTLTSPSNAAFVGVSVKVAWMGDYRVNEGDTVLDWEPAGISLQSNLVSAMLSEKADTTYVNEQISTLSGLVGKAAKPFAGLEYLKRARIKVRKRLRNVAGQVVIAAHMDSWGSAFNINYAVAYQNLRLYNGGYGTALGLGGPGWIGLAYVSTSVKANTLGPGGLYTVSRTGTWTDNFGTDTHSPDACSAQTSDATATYTITSTNTANIPNAMKLIAGGAGTLEYRFGGAGAYTSVPLSGADRQEITLAGIPATAAWTLEIRNTSTTPIKLMGLLPTSADNGVIYHSINATGTRMQQRAALDPTSFAANAALLNPDIAFLGTPINDRNAGRTPLQWGADTETVIDLWRAFNPAIDIAIIMPPEVGGTNITTTPMSAYLAKALDLVDSKRVALLNFQPLCGEAVADYEHANTNNSLLDSINTHFQGAGGATGDGILLYQEMVLKLITGAA